MRLPVLPPFRPMLAKAIRDLPAAGEMLFEPKWDGFRCLVFRDGDEIELGSRNDRPLTRYFPEILDPLREALPPRCVVDGEIVVVTDDGLDFDALQQRIHPAESRVNRLAGETPASYIAFDLIALDDEDLTGAPFRDRRARLEAVLGDVRPPVHLCPDDRDRDVAADWFERFEGAGFDGVMAKALDDPYQSDKRSQLKVKHLRTADMVVAGYRRHKDGKGIGSLLLGLYDNEGSLHSVGVCSAFTAARRTELIDELAPVRVRRARRASLAAVGRRGCARGPAHAGRAEPMEHRQGPVLRAGAHRVGRRGRVRGPPGRMAAATPRPLRALAARQDARRVPLRPARADRAGRAAHDLRRLTPTTFLRKPPFRGVVRRKVGVWRGVRRTGRPRARTCA